MIPARVVSQDAKTRLETPYGQVTLDCVQHFAPGDELSLFFRSLPASNEARSPATQGLLTVTAPVESVLFQREQFRVTLEGGLFVYLNDPPRPGENITADFRVECLPNE
jgi:hypothetical protein